MRYLAIGPGANRCPLATFDEILNNFAPLKGAKLRCGIGNKGFRFSTIIDFDHQRLKHTLVAAIHGNNLARSGGREFHARRFLIGKDQLTGFHLVAFPDFHRWLHAGVVISDKCYLPDRRSVFDGLFRTPIYGQIEPAFRLNHAFLTTPYRILSINFRSQSNADYQQYPGHTGLPR